MAKLWAGIDAGKAHHHCVVIDADGNRLLSQKIPNDEPALLELIANVLKLAGGDEVIWATDLNHGGPGAADRHCSSPTARTSSTFPAGPSITPPRLYRGEGKQMRKTPP